MLELNVWLVYDADGNVSCHQDGAAEAMERYEDEVGGHEERRCVKVALQAPAPVIPVLTGEVAAEAKGGTLTVQ